MKYNENIINDENEIKDAGVGARLFKKTIAVILSALMLLSCLPLTIFAADKEANTPKEEVIYVNLTADGSVKSIYAVNIFDLDKDGKIVDYGEYESVRNMTSTDEIKYSEGKTTIDAKAGKLYYEAKLESNVMPWNISIKYYMDGTEYTAKDIAGKSGELKIKISIAQNPECKGDFFKAYALQTTLSLDTENCDNISAPGATLANVGSNKQITYTVLPGKGAEADITANVKNFSHSGISVNGIRLNLNIEINEDMINSKIDELTENVKKLDDGASALKEGANELFNGTSTLNGKVGELYNGVGALTNGSSSLADGLSAIASNNDAIMAGALAAFEGICSAAQTMLNAELSKNGLDEVTLTPDTYEEVLVDLLQKVDAENVYKEAYTQALAIVTEQVEKNQDAVYAGYIDSIADSVYVTYLNNFAPILYTQTAEEIVIQQLMNDGKTRSEAESYVNTAEGKIMVSAVVSSMTDEQKEQILNNELASLTDEDKAIIKEAALDILTDDQKEQIRNGYIAELMKSKEVTDQITEIVSKASSAGASITSLKGQLDNYSLFYEGLKTYTDAVSAAATGADTLKVNMHTLYENVGLLKTGVNDLNNGTKTLLDGISQLKAGTETFVARTSDLKNEVMNIIDTMMSSALGTGITTSSFISEDNENILGVQFVIKTEPITAQTPTPPAVPEEKPKNFWQKLLALFGIK